MLDALSGRAPTIVVVTLCAALVAYWAEVPVWLSYGVAIVVGCFAVVVMGARNRREQPAGIEEEDASGSSWIAQELAGKGSPAGTYVLCFFAIVTIMLTGLTGAHALPAWAALALAAAWGVANARYPTGE